MRLTQCTKLLDELGMGKQGKGNTILAMVLEACAEIRQLRSQQAGEEQRAKQLELNQNWLLDQLDRIHRALCPAQIGTWQQRVEQAVKAAERLKVS